MHKALYIPGDAGFLPSTVASLNHLPCSHLGYQVTILCPAMMLPDSTSPADPLHPGLLEPHECHVWWLPSSTLVSHWAVISCDLTHHHPGAPNASSEIWSKILYQRHIWRGFFLFHNPWALLNRCIFCSLFRPTSCVEQHPSHMSAVDAQLLHNLCCSTWTKSQPRLTQRVKI